MTTTKEVFYPGTKATRHCLGKLVPGINKLDKDIALKLLEIGLVTKVEKQDVAIKKPLSRKKMEDG